MKVELSREALEAQIFLYQEAQRRAMDELEGAKANLSACGGAIEACQALLGLLDELEKGEKPESEPQDKKREKKPVKK